ncbi:MAG TPA: GNAT family N-acetyltransferase [Rhizomicrobium sp.]|nr:GNAT family N-acetyltransferase [Rhizomicrobium sp.]
MLSHVHVGVSDFERALAFYGPLMDVLGYPLKFSDPEAAMAGWKPQTADRPLFLIGRPYDGEPMSAGNGQMIVLIAPSREAVERCYQAALAQGGQSEGAPGPRPQYHPNYYGAYFRDPDGNKLCVCCHDPAEQARSHHAGRDETALIRRIEPRDLPALLDIYNHYVRETPITFDIEPRTLAQRKAWLESFVAQGRYQCFVVVRSGAAVGWASSHPYNERAAYGTTVSSSIYLAPGAAGQGLGRRLYAALFDALAAEDVHRVFGGITLPNEVSVRLHRSFGFEHVGTYKEVGRKFGRYWDVATYLKVMPGV